MIEIETDVPVATVSDAAAGNPTDATPAATPRAPETARPAGRRKGRGRKARRPTPLYRRPSDERVAVIRRWIGLCRGPEAMLAQAVTDWGVSRATFYRELRRAWKSLQGPPDPELVERDRRATRARFEALMDWAQQRLFSGCRRERTMTRRDVDGAVEVVEHIVGGPSARDVIQVLTLACERLDALDGSDRDESGFCTGFWSDRPGR